MNASKTVSSFRKKYRISQKIYNDSEKLSSEAKSGLIRMSPFKIRRVLKQLVGCSYEEALILLRFLPYRACQPIAKVLKSAASNLSSNYQIPQSYTFINTAHAGSGPILKRGRPRAKGRMFPIKKYTSHIYITVTSTIGKKQDNLTNNFVPLSFSRTKSFWKK